MNDKVIRYIGLCVGIFLTLFILFIDEYSSKYFFESDIRDTIIYNFFYDLFRGNRYGQLYRGWAEFFWYIFLLGGFWLSWKYRVKTGVIIVGIAKILHDKT